MSDYKHLFDDVTPESDEYAALSMSLIDRVRELNKARGWTQKNLAQRLGKKESSISKWMGGLHNLTLRNIARLNVAFGEPVMCIPGMSIPSVQTQWETKVADAPCLNSITYRCEGPSVENEFLNFTRHVIASYTFAQPPSDAILPDHNWTDFEEEPQVEATMKVVHLQAA